MFLEWPSLGGHSDAYQSWLNEGNVKRSFDGLNWGCLIILTLDDVMASNWDNVSF